MTTDALDIFLGALVVTIRAFEYAPAPPTEGDFLEHLNFRVEEGLRYRFPPDDIVRESSTKRDLAYLNVLVESCRERLDNARRQNPS